MTISDSHGSNSIAIIGTGPSGVAARWALEELKIDFDIIDADLKEDSPFNRAISPLTKEDIKLKLGSNLPYRQFRSGPTIVYGDTKIKNSFTAGGLSEVWGATLLPYQEKTIQKWKLPWSDFVEAYRVVLSKVPYATFSRNPDSNFEEFGNPTKLKINSCFISSITTPTDNKLIEFGASRLAIQLQKENSPGCYYCNKCLEGCVSSHIWSAAHVLRPPTLQKSKAISGIRVVDIFIKTDQYFLRGTNSAGEKVELGPYMKIFLACGPVETFRILSESKFLPNQTQVLDSNTFFFPLILRKKVVIKNDESIALSQVYCHMNGGKGKAEYHFQVYSQSDVLIKRVARVLPLGKYIPEVVLRKITQQVLICIGYRESCNETQITLTRRENGDVYCEDSYKVSKSKLKRDIQRRIAMRSRELWKAGFIFLGLGIKIGSAGEGIHYGANLRHDLEITNRGEVKAAAGVFVVDASSLQSISAGPITLTIMANSFQIVRNACK